MFCFEQENRPACKQQSAEETITLCQQTNHISLLMYMYYDPEMSMIIIRIWNAQD